MTKKPFPKAERNTQILDLKHFDICEYNGILTRRGENGIGVRRKSPMKEKSKKNGTWFAKVLEKTNKKIILRRNLNFH